MSSATNPDSDDKNIWDAVHLVEDRVETMYRLRYKGATNPPSLDMYVASTMAEIARRVQARAKKIEEDWLHFTRE